MKSRAWNFVGWINKAKNFPITDSLLTKIQKSGYFSRFFEHFH